MPGYKLARMRTLGEPLPNWPEFFSSTDDGGANKRVAVVYQSSKSGAAALREAAELVASGSELWVATLAPQAERARCCKSQCEGPYNIAVKEEAARELAEAREKLGSLAERATFTVLSGSPQPPLASWVAEHEFGLVLLPRSRFTLGGNPFARILRKKTRAEVRLV